MDRIPAARRHFYVYVLLILTAVVGNKVHQAAFPIESEDLKAFAIESARIEGLKESTAALYR